MFLASTFGLHFCSMSVLLPSHPHPPPPLFRLFHSLQLPPHPSLSSSVSAFTSPPCPLLPPLSLLPPPSLYHLPILRLPPSPSLSLSLSSADCYSSQREPDVVFCSVLDLTACSSCHFYFCCGQHTPRLSGYKITDPLCVCCVSAVYLMKATQAGSPLSPS